MEKKKLKKLVLKKDIVSKLGNAELNQMRGGAGPFTTAVLDSLVYGSCDVVTCQGGGGGGGASPYCQTYQSCAAVESCVPMQCYDDGYNTINYSQCNCW
jgi:hypothetical protein